jgi:hypothetical protein
VGFEIGVLDFMDKIIFDIIGDKRKSLSFPDKKRLDANMNRAKVARELEKIAKGLVAADTFECPECGTKVLENTGYCVKCKKKVKKASRALISKTYKLKKKATFPRLGFDLEAGTELIFQEYTKRYPYAVRFKTRDGRNVAFLLDRAWEKVDGMPKPPSIRQMEKWMDSGVAKAVDGSRVEPDGFSPKGAPSWLLALGMI